MSERLSIDEIIGDWAAKCSVELTNKNGHPYWGIPSGSSRRECFLDLIQTLLDQGWKKEEIKTDGVRAKVVNTCWPDKERSISAKELRTSKAATANIWEQTVRTVTGIEISKYEGKVSNYVAPTPPVSVTLKESKEEILEEIFNPKDRLISTKKIDRSKDINWELLDALGLEPDEVEDE